MFSRLKQWKLSRKLPNWARMGKDGYIEVWPHKAYPLFVEAAGLKMDQYGLEVARRCMTKYLKELLQVETLYLRILKDTRYKLSNYPEGEGAQAGADGFRKYYSTIVTGNMG